MAADLMDLSRMLALVTGRTRGIKSAPRRRLRSSSPHIFNLGRPQRPAAVHLHPLSGSRIALDQLIGKGKRSTADRVAIRAPRS
jgi:hypothetical protein